MTHLGKKTYIPTLARVLRRVCTYISRYRDTIVKYLPEGGAAALDGIILACDVFMALVPEDLS